MISEDEGDYTRANRLPRPHSYILEEDETEEVEAEVAHARGIDYHGDRLILTPKKGRPPLWWIPSWACLCEMSLTCQQPLLVRTINTADDDQGHMSDGDIAPSKSMRRRLFGRSQDSTASFARRGLSKRNRSSLRPRPRVSTHRSAHRAPPTQCPLWTLLESQTLPSTDI
ncbi:hypothetical protein BJ912DRAFT_422617 [Pholiota molesta]|nr:hypothetical protein BJ912DRAFT_422617 [Pholiota molesta]